MSVSEGIESLVRTADTAIKQKSRRQKVRLYAAGLRAKIRQAQLALQRLSEYDNRSDETITSTGQEEFSITEQVHFYCDTFWTFLYSSLDVMAQLVNQALSLKLKERDVTFKRVKSKLDRSKSGSPIEKRFADCIRSKAFKNLDRYRNCSTHRRQIYMTEETKSVKGTAEYKSSTTGGIVTVVRTLCDNPLKLSPRTTQNRRIPKYMADTRDKILRHIELIVRETRPV